MKKIHLLLLLISFSVFSQSLPVTQANNLKIINPVIGQKTDSVLVWRGSDKFVRWIPASLIGGITPTLDQVAVASGNNMTEKIKQTLSSASILGFETNGNMKAQELTLEQNINLPSNNVHGINFGGNTAIVRQDVNTLGLSLKLAYKAGVASGFTGRELIDYTFYTAGLALKANLNTPNNYIGKQTVAGEISSESSAMDNRINIQTTGPHPNIQSANFDDNAGKALALNAFGLGVSINKFYPEYALDVNGITRADNFITNTATASNHAVPLGQIKTAVKSVTTTTTLTLADYGANKELLVLCSASGGAFSVNIPASATILGYKTRVMKTDSSVNAVTADANGSELINQAATYNLTAQNQVIQLESNSTQLYITN